MALVYTGVEKYIFRDTYNLFIKYQDMQDDDYYWQCCINDARILAFKYHEYPFAKQMIITIMEQLQLKVKGTKVDGRTYNEWEGVLGDYSKLPAFSTKKYKDK